LCDASNQCRVAADAVCARHAQHKYLRGDYCFSLRKAYAVENARSLSTWTSGTYDPAAGIFAGAALGVATGVGIHQIAQAAGYQEETAQAIFQHSTVRPGTTIVGQVMLKPASSQYGTLRLDVPVDTARVPFSFTKTTTRT
jgi:hypothetical protein